MIACPEPGPASPGWSFAQRVSDAAKLVTEIITVVDEGDDQYLVEPPDPSVWSGSA